MAAAPTAVRGLSTADLQTIRATLESGRKPKVMFTEAAGQIAGQLGQVVELTDPELSDEWVVVRFGRDELPFSPADLAIAPKTSQARRAEPKPAPELKITEPPVPAPREEATMTSSTVDALEIPAEPVEAKPARKPARSTRPKGPAGLTVTLAYAEGEWTVAAQQGSKALARPYVIKPAEALKMVGLLDVPGVHEAVEQIVAAERAEAELVAERLRAELAEIEARLAELRDAR
jgi:hypothetical protein